MATTDKDGIGWATDAMMASYERMQVANDNLANVDSRDFHSVLVKIIATPDGLKSIRSISQAAPGLRETGRDLDLAIDGPGTFRVIDPKSGEITETRAGAFSTDRDGFLVDPLGRRLLGDQRALKIGLNGKDGANAKGRGSPALIVTFESPIKVGPTAKVRGDGHILEDGKVVARIPIPVTSQIRSGHLEVSTANSAQAMLVVVDAARTYETASKAYAAIDATRQKMANEVARLK